jgi:hypothetical protein
MPCRPVVISARRPSSSDSVRGAPEAGLAHLQPAAGDDQLAAAVAPGDDPAVAMEPDIALAARDLQAVHRKPVGRQRQLAAQERRVVVHLDPQVRPFADVGGRGVAGHAPIVGHAPVRETSVYVYVNVN